ncbi:lipoyl(octanoyl) transferase LipB [Salinibacter ruber]|uniref:Octanoyltransferase n=1 Tax=Salinibacter ruber TaxID=146919 RepID=A0A9X2UL56_9BACT|nr:lipoyl(octanoyl) transferase LipB [Salinibacter ruber]MBB4090395.1 lipoyl(octanoyl) transferase [Salinibacter ruber]MCS3611705.1 lipoyl(octanoyl) transferase [Salinibacter ruber]MCS3613800.1 lipoyl(octanoyl) transferase [Salinibacter ruber]MCS3645841.1 lipoyl(octanoyl) transferase [Salinibacter ruber]MCS3673587.1 lipoyl(octanoyl) transferase [Salinibacter ruber]
MSSSAQNEIVACHLGRVSYERARALQERVQERLIAAKRAEPPEPEPHVLLLLEHPPVYTLGKSGDAANLLVSEERLEEVGATFHRIGRGGDVTFHGPGQLVGYPLFDLDRFFTDLGRYLRTLEEAIIRTCADYGVTGTRVDGRTGVWVGPDDRGPERKICAMGVRCSRWVTMHGFALNVTTDLDYFDHIVPCGIDDRGVTSLAAETDAPGTVDDVCGPVTEHFGALFDAEVTTRHGADARSFLGELTGERVEALGR